MGKAGMMFNELYKNTMLRQWSIDLSTGDAVCLQNAVDVGEISEGAQAAIEAKNQKIEDAIAKAIVYETEQFEEEVDPSISALVALRSGVFTETDRNIVAMTWNEAVDIAAYGPAPVPRRKVDKWVIIERVAAAGKGAQAKALLNAPGNETALFKWNAPVVSVYFDDPDTVQMILALGLDPEIIMAPPE